MRVLCFDAGSSSLKFALYDQGDEGGRPLRAGTSDSANLAVAVDKAWSDLGEGGMPDAIGHRIVFGGEHRHEPVKIGEGVLRELERLRAWDPLHLGSEVAIVEAAMRRFPGVPQVACFDTAFFRALPALATRLPLPAALAHVRRRGFHGLAYESVLSSLAEPWGRTVVAHLGSGASLCAIRDGSPVETTMGFSVLGGLMMGTRPGDLDPGVILELMRCGYSMQELGAMLYEESGLKGVSSITSDMRELLALESAHPQAAEAIALFVHQLRKHLGAMIAALGGIDRLVFTGGIGEHAPEIRSRACEAFHFLSLRLDGEANARNDPVISTEDSGVAVRVIAANENAMIAHHVFWLLRKS